jgi:hypothetical protein
MIRTPSGWADGSLGRRLPIDTSASGYGTIGLTPLGLAGGGAEVVGASGFEAGPLGGGTFNLIQFSVADQKGHRS